MRNFISATFLILICFSLQASPSFDCSKATTAVEKTICSNAQLSSLDRELSVLYKEFGSEQRDAQRAWIKQRNLCQADTACLVSSYRDRISSIKTHTAKANAQSNAEASAQTLDDTVKPHKSNENESSNRDSIAFILSNKILGAQMLNQLGNEKLTEIFMSLAECSGITLAAATKLGGNQSEEKNMALMMKSAGMLAVVNIAMTSFGEYPALTNLSSKEVQEQVGKGAALIERYVSSKNANVKKSASEIIEVINDCNVMFNTWTEKRQKINSELKAKSR